MAERHEQAARYGAARLSFRQRWAILSAANIYGAIGREVLRRGEKAWDHRVRTSSLQKIAHVWRAFFEAMRKPDKPAQMPEWTRGKLMVKARMEGPVAPMPTTPLPDEE
jgi:phytoene synthase